MPDDYHIRRDRSALASGSIFGRQKRRSFWKFGAFAVPVILVVLALNFNALRPQVLSIVKQFSVTPTPTANDYFRRGDTAFSEYGDLGAAITNYREAAKQLPTNVDIVYELARMLLYRSYDNSQSDADSLEALKWTEPLTSANPTNARAYSINCFALVTLQRVNEAVNSCQKAVQLDPNEVDAHAYLSMAYLERDNPQDASREAQIAVDGKSPSLDAYTAYAQVLGYLGQYKQALDYYDKATTINRHLKFPYFNKGYLAYSIAITKNDNASYLTAIDAYNAVLSMDRKNVKAYVRLCQMYLASGETNLARDNCSTASETDGAYSPAWRWLGEVQYRTTDYAGAIVSFGKCADIEQGLPADKRQPECWVFRGLAQYQLNKDCTKALPLFYDVLTWTHDSRAIRLSNQGVFLCQGH